MQRSLCHLFLYLISFFLSFFLAGFYQKNEINEYNYRYQFALIWSPDHSLKCWWLHSISTVDLSLYIILLITINNDKKVEDIFFFFPQQELLINSRRYILVLFLLFFLFFPQVLWAILYLLLKMLWKYLNIDISSSTAGDTQFLTTIKAI